MTSGLFTSTPHDGDGERARVIHLSAHGVSGTATIVAIRRTGRVARDNPECEIDLRVVIGSAAPYAATARQLLAPVAIPHFRPGKQVPVKIDPADHRSVIIA